MNFTPTAHPVHRSLTILLLLLAIPAYASSPVWKIEKDGTKFYLGGTMHILTTQDYPLPQAFETAYQQSEQIVFETDIARMNDPAIQQYLLREVSYEEGDSLRQVIDTDTWDALSAFFTARSVPMSSIETFKPGMVATMITIIELQRLGVDTDGVDAYFNRRASADGKDKVALETVEQQVAFLADLGNGHEDALLRYSLIDIERLPTLWRELTRAWRSGDTVWLNENLAQPMLQEFPSTYRTLLSERNDDWMPRLEVMAATAQTEFVLVGALHLVGKDGLLAQLRERGYRVTQQE